MRCLWLVIRFFVRSVIVGLMSCLLMGVCFFLLVIMNVICVDFVCVGCILIRVVLCLMVLLVMCLIGIMLIMCLFDGLVVGCFWYLVEDEFGFGVCVFDYFCEVFDVVLDVDWFLWICWGSVDVVLDGVWFEFLDCVVDVLFFGY